VADTNEREKRLRLSPEILAVGLTEHEDFAGFGRALFRAALQTAHQQGGSASTDLEIECTVAIKVSQSGASHEKSLARTMCVRVCYQVDNAAPVCMTRCWPEEIWEALTEGESD